MKWLPVYLCLALALLAAPVLGLEAVPFGGFSGLILGGPNAGPAEMSAAGYVALYSLGEFDGPTEVGVICEVEENMRAFGRRLPKGKFFVNVSLMRQNGGEEFVARIRMRMRDGKGEGTRIRTMSIQPGDYLVFQFTPKRPIQLAAGQQLMLTGYAGAPGVR